MTEPRLKPQGPDEWSDAAREMFALFEGPEAREKGSKSNLVRIFAHHPKLMTLWMKFNGRMLAAPKVPPRVRELVILRIADRYRCEYEWLQHVDIAIEMGMGQEHFDAVKVGPEAPIWSDLERNALRAADEMMNDYSVSDATWAALAQEFDKQQMLEFLFVVGVYSALAWILNSTGVKAEPTAGQGQTNYLQTTLSGKPATQAS